MGEYERAIYDYNEAIRLRRENADAYTMRGVAYANLGQDERAIQDYDEAIRLDSFHAVTYEVQQGDTLSSIAKRFGVLVIDLVGINQLSNENVILTGQVLQITVNHGKSEAYYNRGMVYFHFGQRDRAIKDFDEAIRLNPQFATAYYARGFAHQKLGRMARANQDFEEAIRINPNLKRS